MPVSVEYLVQQVRLVSGLRSNALFSDLQIATLLTDAYADLRDRLIVRFVTWFKREYAFTLAGGNDGNTLDLSAVPLLETVLGVDYVDSNGNRFTVDMLDSFASRNQGNTTWPLVPVGYSYNGFMGRNYAVEGDELVIRPPPNSNGNYILIYAPMLTTLALPLAPGDAQVRSVTHDGADGSTAGSELHLVNANFSNSDLGATIVITGAGNALDGTWTVATVVSGSNVTTSPAQTPSLSAGALTIVTITDAVDQPRTFAVDIGDTIATNQFNLFNGNFTTADIGRTLIPVFDPPNDTFNVEFTIDDVVNFQTVDVTPNPLDYGAGLASPAGDVTVSLQPANTVDEIPQSLTPWQKYLVLFASIAIRSSRDQATTDLDQQFAVIKQRVIDLTKQRSQGVAQAPKRSNWGTGWGR